MRPTPAVYEIRTVLDFLKVPEERRALCLSEFETFLKIVAPACVLMGHVADATIGDGELAFRPVDLYRWVDDDRGAFGMNIHLPDGTEYNVFDLTPDDAAKIGANLAALESTSTTPAKAPLQNSDSASSMSSPRLTP